MSSTVRRWCIAFCMAFVAMLAVNTVPASAAPYRGLLLNTAELSTLSGTAAPTYVKQQADAPYTAYNGGWQQGITDIDLANQDSTGDTVTLAAALLYATGQAGFSTTNAQLLTKVCGALNTVMTAGPDGSLAPTNQPTPPKDGARALSIARGLPSYIYAYDLVNAPTNCGISIATFTTFLNRVVAQTPGAGGGYSVHGGTLPSCLDHRVNNWGAYCQQTMIAKAALLNDSALKAHVAEVFRAFAGQPTALGGTYTYAAGDWGTAAYQADPANKVGINRPGTTIGGNNVDGMLPEDQRRTTGTACSTYTPDVFTFPICRQNYTWEDTQAEIMVGYHLQREGYDGLNMVSKALKRVVAGHYTTGRYNNVGGSTTFPATADDAWIIPLANKLYSTSYAPSGGYQAGKNMIGADWWTAATSTTENTGKAPPTAPDNLSSLYVQKSSFDLYWGTPVDADSSTYYKIYKNGALYETTLANGDTHTYTFNNVCGNTTGWQVSQVTGGVESVKSTLFYVTQQNCTTNTLETPKVFQEGTSGAPAGSPNTAAIYFSWRPLRTPGGVLASTYRVWKNGTLMSSPPLVVTSTKVTSALLNLPCDTNTTIEVAGVTAGGVEGPKGTVSMGTGHCNSTDSTIPGIPANFTSNWDPFTPGVDFGSTGSTDNVGVSVYVLSGEVHTPQAFKFVATSDVGSFGTTENPPCGDPVYYELQAIDAAANRGNAAELRFALDCETGTQVVG